MGLVGLSLSLYLEAGIFSKAIEALIKKRLISFTYFSFFHFYKTFGHYCLFFLTLFFYFSTGFLFDASVILKLNLVSLFCSRWIFIWRSRGCGHVFQMVGSGLDELFVSFLHKFGALLGTSGVHVWRLPEGVREVSDEMRNESEMVGNGNSGGEIFFGGS